MKFRWNVTTAERKKIAEMTKRGVRQSVISRTLGIAAPEVSRAQTEKGLPTVVPTPEKEIMELFRSGVGGYEISKRLKCPVNRVWAVMHKHGFTRADKLASQHRKKTSIISSKRSRTAKGTSARSPSDSTLASAKRTGSRIRFWEQFVSDRGPLGRH